jgi:chromosomal replication initiation ATPase DnaA
MITSRQLPLPFEHQPRYHESDFIAAASNEQARAWLADRTNWPAGRLVIWGESGAGKSHLLHIWARRSGASIIEAACLPGATEPLGSLAVPLIGIEAIDRCADEAGLLHLLNRVHEAGGRAVMTAHAPAARLPMRLADLASRLKASGSVQITPPDDELLRALWVRLCAERQLVVPQNVQNFLLARLPRSAQSLRDAVMQLDRAGLAEKSQITRPLAAALLADLLGPESSDLS